MSQYEYLTEEDVLKLKKLEWLCFFIHLLVFVIINIVLHFLNKGVGPYNFVVNGVKVEYLHWAIFPLIAWGIGLITHFIIVLFFQNPLIHWRDAHLGSYTNEYKNKGIEISEKFIKWAKQKDEEKIGYVIHFIFFIYINLILIYLNYSGIGWQTEGGVKVPSLFIGFPNFPWFLFALFGWGFGLGIHTIVFIFGTVLAGYKPKEKE